MQLAGRARRYVHHDNLIRSRDEALALEPDITDMVSGASAGRVEVQLTPVARHSAIVTKINPQIAERLIGFGEQALHLLAELIGGMVVLPFEHSMTDLSQILAGIPIVTISRFAGPERVFIDLEDLVSWVSISA